MSGRSFPRKIKSYLSGLIFLQVSSSSGARSKGPSSLGLWAKPGTFPLFTVYNELVNRNIYTHFYLDTFYKLIYNNPMIFYKGGNTPGDSK